MAPHERQSCRGVPGRDHRGLVPVPTRIAPLIKDRLETRPLVARRHYIETGNLRHFRVPVIWLIHDEFAEWMMVEEYKDAVTQIVGRLGVKARAAGIHLVFAAQRPDASVMPMQLRANLGNRLILEGSDSVGIVRSSRSVSRGPSARFGHGHMATKLEGSPGIIYAQGTTCRTGIC